MSLLGLFEIGRSAIGASQTAINTTSHNIANVNTPGYNRQEVVLSIASPVALGSSSYLGRGVSVQAIRSSYNQFLQAQLVGQQQVSGRSTVLSQSLSQVEQVFNEVQGMGLGSYLTDYFNSWNDVAMSPDSQPQRTLLLQKATSLVQVAGQVETGIKDSLTVIDKSIGDVVSRVNTLATNIAKLNGSILQAEGGSNSASANDLRNQRDVLLTQLADLTEYTSYVNTDGTVGVNIGMRNLVNRDQTNTLKNVMNNDGNQDIYLDDVKITSNITKGQLGGLLAVNSSIQSGPLLSLRRLIASITQEVNLQHRAGFDLNSAAGGDFFNNLQLNVKNVSAGLSITLPADISTMALNDYKIQFDGTGANYSIINMQTGAATAPAAYVSGNPISFGGITVTVTGVAAANDSITVSPLTDAIKNFSVAITDSNEVAASSVAAEVPGNNSNALLMAGMSEFSVANLGATTFSEYYGGIVSLAGTMSAAAADSLRFDNAILADVQNKREAASGVSLDEEAANLIRFQRSFEAGARMISTADELMQTILNM
ncbi:MAG: flagellar hook-associated protein FlgK [Thermodesulfovibrio sp.]|nr:flagellar hook-associated protein FlgK [Thermodesulfovibrio sp.]